MKHLPRDNTVLVSEAGFENLVQLQSPCFKLLWYIFPSHSFPLLPQVRGSEFLTSFPTSNRIMSEFRYPAHKPAHLSSLTNLHASAQPQGTKNSQKSPEYELQFTPLLTQGPLLWGSLSWGPLSFSHALTTILPSTLSHSVIPAEPLSLTHCLVHCGQTASHVRMKTVE